MFRCKHKDSITTSIDLMGEKLIAGYSKTDIVWAQVKRPIHLCLKCRMLFSPKNYEEREILK